MTDQITQNIKENDTKLITIPLFKWNVVKVKKEKVEKDKITKIGSRSWIFLPNQNTTEFQHGLLMQLRNNVLSKAKSNTHNYFCQEIIKLLKIKRSSYKSQDILKNKYNINAFVSLDKIIQLLCESKLICLYCEAHVSVLYEYVYEPKQWTLDRIDNTLGHNEDNVVIACLECNLKRRLTNKDKFHLSKKMVYLVREDYED